MRIKRHKMAHKRRKNVLRQAKGYIHARSKKYRAAKEALLHAGVYAYRDRRVRKREFRKLWIIRINNAVRKYGLTYSQFINKLTQAKIGIDRKMLAELAVNNPKVLEKIIEEIK